MRTFLRFWYDFVVGDDWRVAAGVLLVLAAGALLTGLEVLPDAAVAPLAAAGIVTVATLSILAGARR
jgi:hypothetical protein